MADTADVIAIAEKAHEGQMYGEFPYLSHPLHLANALAIFGKRACHVAILHDVIEDSDTTAQDLAGAGVDPSVVEAVETLTRGDQPYEEYILNLVQAQESGSRQGDTPTLLTEDELRGAGVAPGTKLSLPVLVKLADNLHNTQKHRLIGKMPEGKENLARRYNRAYEVLSSSIPDEVVELVKRCVDGEF